MKKRHYLFIAIFSYLLFLVFTIPVTPVVNFINSNTTVKIHGASGTIWNGKAINISINNIANLSDTEWKFTAWKIITGRIAFLVSTHYDEQVISGETGVSFLKQFFVNNLSGKITSENITQLANIPIMQLSGMVTIDIKHAHWKADELPLASGNITWNEAAITVVETASLGNLTIELGETDQHLLNADINNVGGDILVSGNAELAPEASYAVNIKLSPTPSASENIKNSLSSFAEKQANGDFIFKKAGQLNQLGLQ